MFATDQVKQWESKFQHTIAEAQKVAQARARQVEAEARKAFELLGDRAQAEVKQLLSQAQSETRDQWVKVGEQFIKFGTKIQEMAKPVAAAAAPAASEAPAPVVVEVASPAETQAN
jgi:vacuolar-type H+-ATPase subunit H